MVWCVDQQLDVTERELRSRSSRIQDELAECTVREQQLVAMLRSSPDTRHAGNTQAASDSTGPSIAS